MKKYLLSTFLLAFAAMGMNAHAQSCNVTAPFVTGLTSTPSSTPGICNYTFNITFSLVANNGNKRIGIYLYSGSPLPNSLYGNNGSQVPDANQLDAVSNILGVIQINNDVVSATTAAQYTGGNLSQNPVKFLASLPYFKIPTTDPDSSIFTIQGITVQAPCGGLNIMADVGSAQAASFNSFGCLVRNLSVTGTTPNVLGALIGCSAPNFFQFAVNMASAGTITFSAYSDATLTTPVAAPTGFTYTGNGTVSPLPISTYQNITLDAAAGTTAFGQFRFTNVAAGTPIYLVIQSSNALAPVVVMVDNTCAALPVNFTIFTATRSRDIVRLHWETANETNNRFYEVQRLVGNGNWEAIGNVATQAQNGNSATALSYDFTDQKALQVNSQYRIRQVDIDGASHYSEIRLLKGEGLLSNVIMFPNPIRDGIFNIVFNKPNGVYRVQLVDAQGRLVREWANTRTNVTMNGLRSGQYLVMITDQSTNETLTNKIIVQ